MGKERGITLLEIVIVIGLIGFTYVLVLPNLSVKTGTEVATKLARLNADIRTAFDSATLTDKNYRFVFNFAENTYWLEYTDRRDFYPDPPDTSAFALSDEEKKEELLGKFEQYRNMITATYRDPESDDEKSLSSPVLESQEDLMPPEWIKSDSIEFQERSLGDTIAIRSIHAEHNAGPVGPENGQQLAYLYVKPGHIEKAIIRVSYKLDENTFDNSQKPYSIVVNPNQGQGEIFVGEKEFSFYEEEKEEEY